MSGAPANSSQLTRATAFVEDLVLVLVNYRIFYPGHPRIKESIRKVLGQVEELLGDSPAMILKVFEETLLFGEEPLVGASLSAARLIQRLGECRAGGVEFLQGVTERDLEAFLAFLSSPPPMLKTFREANRILERKGCSRIRFLGLSGKEELENEEALTVYQGMMDYLQEVTIRACKGEVIPLDPGKERVAKVLGYLDEDPLALFRLANYEQYDPLTLGHSARVTLLALEFARRTEGDKDLLVRVGLAALLHDVGKAWVPLEILESRKALTPDQRREMDRHPLYGAEILASTKDMDPMAVAGAFGHHRNPGGQGGYPRLTAPAPVSNVSRLLKICDIFEALTAPRPYKEPLTPLQAWRVLLEMKGELDPGVLKKFMAVIGLYPTGTMVKLGSGEIGMVVAQGREMNLPKVKLLKGRKGEALPPEGQVVLDLSKEQKEKGIRIAGTAVSL